VGNNHLGVGLGTQSTRLKQRLFIPDTLAVDVESSVDVINSVDNKVKGLPELIIEDIFGVGTNSSHVAGDVEVGVHGLSNVASSLGLGVTNITLSEKELSVKVGNLNVVIISTVNLTVVRATETHESKGLDVLATEGTGTNHKGVDILESFLNFTTVHSNLIIVSAVHGFSVNFVLGQRFEYIIVEPLLERRVFASKLDNFLSNDSTEEGGLSGDGAGREGSSLSDNIFVEFINIVERLFSVGVVPFLGNLNSLIKIILGVSWEATLSLSESMDSHDSSVELLRSSKESQVRSLKHTILRGGSRVSTGLSKAVELNLLRNLDVFNKTLSLIGLHSRGIKLNLEGMGGSANNLDGVLQLIDAIQTLNFREFNIITFLVTVSLVLVHSNNSWVSVGDMSNNERLALLTISIVDHEFITVIKEGVAASTKSLTSDETNSVISAEFVNSNEVIHTTVETISIDDNIVLEVLFHREGSEEVNLDVWVELSELTNAGLSSGNLADVFFLEVEVAREIFNSSDSRIIDIEGTRSSKDKVLSSLNTKTTHTNDKNSHLDELAHSLHTEGSDLSGVKVGIDFHFFF